MKSTLAELEQARRDRAMALFILRWCRILALVFLFLSLFFTDDIAAVEAFGMAFVGLCCLKG